MEQVCITQVSDQFDHYFLHLHPLSFPQKAGLLVYFHFRTIQGPLTDNAYDTWAVRIHPI